MKKALFALMVLIGLPLMSYAQSLLYTPVGTTISFTASVLDFSTVELDPYRTAVYANTGDCVVLVCADPGNIGRIRIGMPGDFAVEDAIPDGSGDLDVTANVVAEGFMIIEIVTEDNSNENFACTFRRDTIGQPGCTP